MEFDIVLECRAEISALFSKLYRMMLLISTTIKRKMGLNSLQTSSKFVSISCFSLFRSNFLSISLDNHLTYATSGIWQPYGKLYPDCCLQPIQQNNCSTLELNLLGCKTFYMIRNFIISTTKHQYNNNNISNYRNDK